MILVESRIVLVVNVVMGLSGCLKIFSLLLGTSLGFSLETDAFHYYCLFYTILELVYSKKMLLTCSYHIIWFKKIRYDRPIGKQQHTLYPAG